MAASREELIKAARRVRAVVDPNQTAFNRYPLVFTLVGTFGVVATFYGFERVIDQIAFFNENPYILLGIGLAILVVTGTVYKKLQ